MVWGPTYVVSKEQFSLQNFMDTCHRKGMLYAFFLKIAKIVVCKIVHQQLKVPVNGKEMYRYLQDFVKNRCPGGYKEYINDCWFLLDYQKKELLPESGEIDLEKMDFTMYMSILKLIQKNYIETGMIRYLKDLRKEFCHVSFISLEQGMSQEEFKIELNLMEIGFNQHGIDNRLVKMCKEDILHLI